MELVEAIVTELRIARRDKKGFPRFFISPENFYGLHFANVYDHVFLQIFWFTSSLLFFSFVLPLVDITFQIFAFSPGRRLNIPRAYFGNIQRDIYTESA